MIQAFIEIDQSVMLWINGFDFPSVIENGLIYTRNKYFWIPLYIFLIAKLAMKYKKKTWIIILGIAACMTISDTMSSKIIKPTVQRIRPCNALTELVENRVDCGSGFSFPSSHATNHFALAFFLIFIFSPLKNIFTVLFISWASAISLAQVYVGVHYPIDILAGSILGSAIGFLVAKIVLHLYKKSI